MTNNAVSPGLPVIYSSGWQTEQPLSASNTQVKSKVFSLQASSSACVQVFIDGGCAVDYIFQVTMLPIDFNRFSANVNGATARDDGFDSLHWDVTPNGTGTITGADNSHRIQTLVLSTSIFRNGRVIFKYKSGGSGKVTAILGTSE